jgi:hypothetical protein
VALTPLRAFVLEFLFFLFFVFFVLFVIFWLLTKSSRLSTMQGSIKRRKLHEKSSQNDFIAPSTELICRLGRPVSTNELTNNDDDNSSNALPHATAAVPLLVVVELDNTSPKNNEIIWKPQMIDTLSGEGSATALSPPRRKSLGGRAIKMQQQQQRAVGCSAPVTASSPFKSPFKQQPRTAPPSLSAPEIAQTDSLTTLDINAPLLTLEKHVATARARLQALQERIRGIESETNISTIDPLISKWRKACQQCVRDVAEVGRKQASVELWEFDSSAEAPTVTLKSVLNHFHIKPSLLFYDKEHDDFKESPTLIDDSATSKPPQVTEFPNNAK